MAGRAPGFFDIDERSADLSGKRDDLERLAGVVDFEFFRAALEAAVSRGDYSKGGRPRFDAVRMFKILLLQAMHSLSDGRAEYLLKDRLSLALTLEQSAKSSIAKAIELPLLEKLNALNIKFRNATSSSLTPKVLI